ncbi:MAG: DUF1499 domain-containing protein [Sulfitobacter sp.]|nr:DUF1499 domain-containing protein [Sulfitobacter sp.]
MRMIGWIVLIVLIGLAASIRLAPSDPARWHRGTGKTEVGEVQRKGSYAWRAEVAGDGREILAKIDQVAMATPRTRRLAGSVEEGQITYVTRTRVMGFPDYTTVSLVGEDPKILEIFARLRFGRSDFGVNAARVREWRRAIE